MSHQNTIAFHLLDEPDPELTCVVCRMAKCDKTLSYGARGSRTWAGIHSRCIKEHEIVTRLSMERASREDERETIREARELAEADEADAGDLQLQLSLVIEEYDAAQRRLQRAEQTLRDIREGKDNPCVLADRLLGGPLAGF